MSTQRDIKAGMPQVSVLSTTLYNFYINDTPQTNDVNLVLFVDDTSLYATKCKEGHILRKLQRVLSSWWPGVSARTLKLMKNRLGQSTSPIELNQLSLFIE
jgi:hypothetical protein